jgi:uncharacterized membrane protein YccC
MAARALGTTVGSALALLAYVAWPTWERGRVRAALADLIEAYRRYFLAVLDGDRRVRADVRAATRSARTNAQASLDRLRSEPRADRPLIATAEGIFANANRFLRAAMALEAARLGAGDVPARAQVDVFARQVAQELSDIAQALRAQHALKPGPRLRDAQRSLAATLDAAASDDAQRVLAAAWVEGSDRITDSVNTLAHLLR